LGALRKDTDNSEGAVPLSRKAGVRRGEGKSRQDLIKSLSLLGVGAALSIAKPVRAEEVKAPMLVWDFLDQV
jgi:hypothetical protein